TDEIPDPLRQLWRLSKNNLKALSMASRGYSNNAIAIFEVRCIFTLVQLLIKPENQRFMIIIPSDKGLYSGGTPIFDINLYFMDQTKILLSFHKKVMEQS